MVEFENWQGTFIKTSITHTEQLSDAGLQSRVLSNMSNDYSRIYNQIGDLMYFMSKMGQRKHTNSSMYEEKT